MNSKNLLIGAVSGNYTPNDLHNWVSTSVWDDCDRVLLLYNPSDNGLEEYLQKHNITVIVPNFDFWGNQKDTFNFNTGVCNFDVSYDLIHNIRFFHIWKFLDTVTYNKILITDVKDVYFNSNPFNDISNDGITASSEMITYQADQWNVEHVHYNLGIIGLHKLLNQSVYNVGVFGGNINVVKELCADIYLMSVGKFKVADQTSFNYLIQTKYKDITNFTNLSDNFAVHLHVVNAGLVEFNLENRINYKIIHQYDRIAGYTI